MWTKPYGMIEGLLIGGGLIVSGLMLELSVGPVDWDAFRSSRSAEWGVSLAIDQMMTLARFLSRRIMSVSCRWGQYCFNCHLSCCKLCNCIPVCYVNIFRFILSYTVMFYAVFMAFLAFGGSKQRVWSLQTDSLPVANSHFARSKVGLCP